MEQAEESAAPVVPVDLAGKDVLVLSASGEGFAVLESFFASISPGAGVAYVVILRPSPDYRRRLAEVRRMASLFPVVEVRERLAPKPDHVYVVSDGTGLLDVHQDAAATARAGERDIRGKLQARVAERTREVESLDEALRREVVERTRSDEARVRLLGQLVDIAEEERRRISRELHDEFGQKLTALGLKLATVKAAPELPQGMRREIEALERIARRLEDDVDFLVWKLRPTGLDDLGIDEALADYLAGWSRNVGVRAQLHCDLAARLPSEVETIIYRIAQEALNNVAKHARASRVDVSLASGRDGVTLEVTDDGQGFDASVPAKSFGLLGIRERAGLVGGKATITSSLGSGTRLLVHLPGAPESS